MKRMFQYLFPLRRRIVGSLLIKITGSAAELFIPFLLTHILERVIATGDVRRIIFNGVLMIVCAGAAWFGNITANRMAAGITADFATVMRRDLFTRTVYLSARDTDRFTIPSLELRLTSDTYNLQNFVAMMQRAGVRAPFLLIGGIIITLSMDAGLALVMIATLPFICLTVYSVSRRGVPLYTDVQRAADRMVRVVREDIQGIRVIKALSKNDYEHARYDTANRDLCRAETRAGTIMGISHPVMTMLMNLGIAAVVAVSAVRVANGTSSAATVIAFMQYFTQIGMAMTMVTRMFVSYTKCAASANRIAEVLDTPEALERVEDDGNGDGRWHLEFDDVTFSYYGKRPNLEHVSVKVARGGTLGIIGATGSGKSTFVKLLLRFYDTDSGVIRIDGRDIRSYTKAELTSLFGVALQNDFLYADTIAENIRFGRDLSDDAVRTAAAIAQADGFITAIPDGYEHRLSSKGTNVSGGQRQRILIARAIAARPEIVVLDDSSSALDYKTDADLRRALREEMAGCTVVTVAQRVSAVKHCDQILVLDGGRIIGSGTHDELLTSCEAYREISDSQMGGAFLE